MIAIALSFIKVSLVLVPLFLAIRAAFVLDPQMDHFAKEVRGIYRHRSLYRRRFWIRLSILCFVLSLTMALYLFVL